MNADQYFDNMQTRVENASSTNELIEIMTEGWQNREQWRRSYRATFNKRFKGNLEKCRRQCIIEVGQYRANYDDHLLQTHLEHETIN